MRLRGEQLLHFQGHFQLVLRDGVHAWRRLVSFAEQHRAAAEHDSAGECGDVAGDSVSAQNKYHSQGHQAGEHFDLEGGPLQADRLRAQPDHQEHRQGPNQQQPQKRERAQQRRLDEPELREPAEHDHDRELGGGVGEGHEQAGKEHRQPDRWHFELHGAGAVSGRRGGRAHRLLGVRCAAVRAVHVQGAVLRRRPEGDEGEHSGHENQLEVDRGPGRQGVLRRGRCRRRHRLDQEVHCVRARETMGRREFRGDQKTSVVQGLLVGQHRKRSGCAHATVFKEECARRE